MLEALAQFRESTGAGNLWLVGSGSERHQRSLAKLAQRLGVEHNVVFWGRVSSSEKYRLMAEAHVLLMASVREGWGLVVTEANACGTPAIVYDAPGLRDSVQNELTGLVVRPTPLDLSKAMVRVTNDPELYVRLTTAARDWARTFSYDAPAQRIREALESRLAE
jgi:glycosyltransferase involved in cell wall biosynthesis